MLNDQRSHAERLGKGHNDVVAPFQRGERQIQRLSTTIDLPCVDCLLGKRQRRDLVHTRGVVTPRQRFPVVDRHGVRVAPHARRPSRLLLAERNAREGFVLQHAGHTREPSYAQLRQIDVNPAEIERSHGELGGERDIARKTVRRRVKDVSFVERSDDSAVLAVELVLREAEEQKDEEEGEKRAENHVYDVLEMERGDWEERGKFSASGGVSRCRGCRETKTSRVRKRTA